MAEGDDASGGQTRSRSVLGDVTNRIGKRGFSVREKDSVKSFDFNDENAVKRACVSPLPSSEINSLKGNVISSLSKTPNLHDDSDGVDCLKGKINVNSEVEFQGGCDEGKILDLKGGNVVSLSLNESDVNDINSGDGCGKMELSKNSLAKVDEVAKVLDSIVNEADGCSQLDLIKDNKISESALVVREKKCSSLDFGVFGSTHSAEAQAKNELDGDSSDTLLTVSRDFPQVGQSCDVGEDITSHEHTQSDINDHLNELEHHNADNFVMSQSGSMDCVFLPQSQESRVFGVDKSTEVKEVECAQKTTGTDAIKDCSCSFCTKAAYIWLDLNQRDIKARLTALKKSQKEASILAEKSCRIKVNEKHGAESFTRGSKLESHLKHQWRSLFQHMSDRWEAESSQLEASLLPLNNLRERYKAEMELGNANQPEKH